MPTDTSTLPEAPDFARRAHATRFYVQFELTEKSDRSCSNKRKKETKNGTHCAFGYDLITDIERVHPGCAGYRLLKKKVYKTHYT